MNDQQEPIFSGFSSIYESTANSLDTTYLEPGIYLPKNKQTRSQNGSRNQPKRFVFKNGEFNIHKARHSSQRSLISRWFIIMVETRWRWTLIYFFMAFTSDWLFFGFLYWIIAMIHGDLSEEHLPTQNVTDWIPCINNMYGFTSSFLFSIEVHTTVAYGKRTITLECPQTITVMCFQCIISQILQSLMVGILFAKFTRPKARTKTILFSKQAVITLRDGNLCLIFRVGDMRKSRILNIKVSLYMLKSHIDDNCEQTEMKVEMDGCESTFFMWPVSVIHNIDNNSPLYNISAAEMLLNKIEILAVFEGIIESTGQPVQARTSYTENDILWGHRFIPMVLCENNLYEVDYSKLGETEKFDVPLCSANEFYSMMPVFDGDCDSS